MTTKIEKQSYCECQECINYTKEVNSMFPLTTQTCYCGVLLSSIEVVDGIKTCDCGAEWNKLPCRPEKWEHVPVDAGDGDVES
jgi:hypothetical protein